MNNKIKKTILTTLTGLFIFLQGCSIFEGYSTESLYPEKINTVYVEMFDNRSFKRGVEYEVSDALAKRIEVDTPYKVVSDRDIADTVLSGYISSIGESTLTVERETGRSLEREVRLRAVFSWKNLETGEYLIENEDVKSAATYSEWQQQGFLYGSKLASNKLAEYIVMQMEKSW